MIRTMKKARIQEIINRLLMEIEEEDIGISLFSIFSSNKEELAFFSEEDRKKVIVTLQRASDDSVRHKKMLERLIALLEEKRG